MGSDYFHFRRIPMGALMNESTARPIQTEQGTAVLGWKEATEPTARPTARKAIGQRPDRSQPSDGKAQADFGPMDLPCLIGRLHRRYLDVLKSELMRQQVNDVSASQ